MDEVDDPIDRVDEDLVRDAEALLERHLIASDAHEALVRDRNQGVDILLELLNPSLSAVITELAFDAKGARDDRDRQDPKLLCDPRDYRRGARPCPSAHARRDKDHVRACHHLTETLKVLLSRGATYVWVRARPKPTCDLLTQLNLSGGVRAL
jgi:hypothetical protein